MGNRIILPLLITCVCLILPYFSDVFVWLVFVSIALLLHFSQAIFSRKHKIIFVVFSVSIWHFIVLFWFNYDYSVSLWDTLSIIAFSIVVLLLFLFLYFVVSGFTGKYYPVVFISIWLVYEIMLVEWDIPFPMLSLGIVLGNFAPLVQWYSITGVFGGTLWVLIINFLFLEFLKSKKNNIALPFVLVGPIIFSYAMYLTEREKSGEEVSVIVVNNSRGNKNHFDKTIELLSREKDDKVALIVCPEGVFAISDQTFGVNKYFSIMKRLLQSNYNQAEIIIGCELESNEKELKNKASYFNLAVQLNSNGVVSFRNKKILVPFGEYVPYRNMLEKADRIKKAIKKEISYRPSYDTIFRCCGRKVLSLICYELYFSNKIREYALNGNFDIICCLANEYAVPDEVYYKQFIRGARIQAISFRRPVIKSTIHGNSIIVSSEGDIIKTAYDTNEVLKGTVIVKPESTYYERLGYKALIFLWGIFISLFILKERYV